MIDLEQELRDTFARREGDVRTLPRATSAGVVKRVRSRQLRNVIGGVTIAVLIVGASIPATRAALQPGPTGPASPGLVIPQGELGSLSRSTPLGVAQLVASGTSDGRLCLRLTGASAGPTSSCLMTGDLEGSFFAPFAGGRRRQGVAYGVTSSDVASVSYRYAGGGSATAIMRTVRAGGLSLQIFLLSSPRPKGQALLAAHDAHGSTVGNPQWVVWWPAPGSGSDTGSCACSALRHERRQAHG